MFDEFDEDNTCLLSLGEIYYVIENLDEMPLSLGKRLCVLKQDRFITFMLTIHEEGSRQREESKTSFFLALRWSFGFGPNFLLFQYKLYKMNLSHIEPLFFKRIRLKTGHKNIQVWIENIQMDKKTDILFAWKWWIVTFCDWGSPLNLERQFDNMLTNQKQKYFGNYFTNSIFLIQLLITLSSFDSKQCKGMHTRNLVIKLRLRKKNISIDLGNSQ